MKPVHIAIAIGLTVVWGLNFVFVRVGLDHFPPLLFATLRFFVAGLPALCLPRPKISVSRLLAISVTLFVGQFAFQFTGIQAGFPPGLASLTLQVQAFFTVILAAATLGERVKARTILGLLIAFSGLAVIATTVGTNGVTVTGLALILASALSWGVGNVIIRGTPPVDMFGLNSWIAALATPPLLILSLAIEGPSADWAALANPTLAGLGALAYVAIPTTILGYWMWGELLKRYTTGTVVPFALLVPVTGTISAWLLLGESFGPIRLAGMALILTGLAVNSLPLDRWLARRPALGRQAQ